MGSTLLAGDRFDFYSCAGRLAGRVLPIKEKNSNA